MSWHPCSCCRDCPHCLGGVAPREFQVEIAGVTAKAPAECDDCGTLDASCVVAPTGDGVPGAFGGCWWDYALETPVCDVARVVLGIGPYTTIPATWIVIVYLVDADGNILAAAGKVYSSDRPACLVFDGETLGALTFYAVGLGCDVSGSSVAVTALRPCGEE